MSDTTATNVTKYEQYLTYKLTVSHQTLSKSVEFQLSQFFAPAADVYQAMDKAQHPRQKLITESLILLLNVACQ